ncbi:MAG: hypothetical protein V3T77_05270, partial [Planctomycetota bacterium]
MYQDPFLKSALLVSFAGHLVALLLCPNLGAPPPLEPMRVTVVRPPSTPAEPPSSPVELPAPPQEETEKEPSPEEISSQMAKPLSEPELPLTSAVTEMEPPESHLSPQAEGVPPTVSPEPEPVSPAAQDPQHDPEKVEAFLAELVAEEQHRISLKRYRFLVRERVRVTLERRHPGTVQILEDQSAFQLILSFRLDPEGYLFDLSLRTPPGSRIDVRALHQGLIALSPFPPPPRDA